MSRSTHFALKAIFLLLLILTASLVVLLAGGLSPSLGSLAFLKLSRLLDIFPTPAACGTLNVTSESALTLCPETPPINENNVTLETSQTTYEEVARELCPLLQNGGRHVTFTCLSRESVALIIPYRDRRDNLLVLLRNLVPFMARQQLDFTIFVVEQADAYPFNRCLLFNVGYVESQKRGNFSCFIIHDTDLIPRDYRNLYRCDVRPRHFVLSRSNENMTEKLPYPSYIGGVLALRRKHMEAVNGCSNYYYGWGFEDDDLELRLRMKSQPVVRYPPEFGGYYALHHIRQTPGTHRGVLKGTMTMRQKEDGLSSLNYTLIASKNLPLYTWLTVQLPPPPPSVYSVTTGQ